MRILLLTLTLLISSSHLTTVAAQAAAAPTTPTQAACNTELGVLTAAQIRTAAVQLLEPYLPSDNPTLQQRALDVILRPAVGDVTVRLLCASCRQVDEWYIELDQDFPEYYLTFCGQNLAQYDTQTSFLVLQPRDADGALPTNTRLRAFLTLPPTEADTAASEQFQRAFFPNDGSSPTSSSKWLSVFLPGLVAASSGAIGLVPDWLGTGASVAQPQTIFYQKAYERALAVPYLFLERQLREDSGDCTYLDNALTIYGVEDGTQAAVHAAFLFRQFEQRTLRAFLSAGPLDVDQWLISVAAAGSSSADATTQQTLNEWLVLTESTYNSQDLPELVSARGALNTLNLDPANPAAYTSNCGTAVSSLEEEGNNETSVCRALYEFGSVWPAVSGDINVFEEWILGFYGCYSEADELLPAPLFENVGSILGDALYERYTGASGFDALSIDGTTANHTTTLNLCSIAPMVFFTLHEFEPDLVEDQGNYVSSTVACCRMRTKRANHVGGCVF